MDSAMKPIATLAAFVLGLIALGHLLRLAIGIEVWVAGLLVPLWMGAPAALALGALAFLLLREQRKP